MEIWKMSAVQIRDGIRSGQLSSVEAVQSHLDRTQAVNPALNAIVETLDQSALSAASQADKLRSREPAEDLPELLGVPFTVKVNLDVVGSPSTAGVPALAEAYPERDSPAVGLMKQAGAIPFARTNMPDLGLRWDTDSSLHGRTLNPWNTAVTPGGSSGGEAAAIATGMSPLGVGNDFGGSVRIPAWACGISALKPGRGRIPGGLPGPKSLAASSWFVNGPLARTIDDLAAALTVLSHPDPRDPESQPPPVAEALDISETTVAVIDNPLDSQVDPAVAQSIDRAAAALRDAGFKVEPATPPGVRQILESRTAIAGYDIMALGRENLAAWCSPDAMKFLDDVHAGHKADAAGYHEGFANIAAARSEWSEFMGRFPLVLAPVYSRQQFAIGDDLKGPEQAAEITDGLGLTLAVNVLELPSVALPTGVIDGLPQGVQIIGRRMREEQCLAAARVIEAALGTITPIDPVD